MPTETVRVVVRSRPLNKNEISKGNLSLLEFDKEIHQISIKDPKTGQFKAFAFDAVYDMESTQQEVYDESAFPLVESTLQGYNATIFAYGQTGCGKTFTMMGIPDNIQSRGVIPNSFAHIFSFISETHNKIFLVKCSYLEIYNEDIRDLLNYDQNTKLELKESPDKGVFIKGLSSKEVNSIADISKVMESGNDHRIVKETKMNEKSSRSHAIFIIYVETSEETEGRTLVKGGKLNLVDLAGSERQKKTGAEGDRLKEAIKINLSLSALGNVISALVDKSSHVPYRDSKLTLLLQDSLGGNTRTLMVAVVSPADSNYEESLSTLRYANRAKSIQNKPKINEDPKDAMIRGYLEEIQRLKALLNGNGPQVIEKRIEKIINIEKSVDDEEVKLPVYNLQKFKVNPSEFKEAYTLKSEDLNDLEDSQAKKVELESIIKEIETKLVVGGEEINIAEKERLKAQKQYQRKLKQQKKREMQLIEEKKKKDEEFLNIEKRYINMQEEVEDLRKIVKKLREDYKSSINEIKNLNHEHEDEKENLLEDLRDQSIENDFLIGLLGTALPINELETIKKRSNYDEIEKKWVIPEFTVDNKQTLFPKINNDINKISALHKNQDKKQKSKKNLKQDNYYSDQPDFRYEDMLENDSPVAAEDKNNGRTGNMFRDHFQFIDEKKKEIASSHNELPPVHDTNKKQIADAFNLKQRRGKNIKKY